MLLRRFRASSSSSSSPIITFSLLSLGGARVRTVSSCGLRTDNAENPPHEQSSAPSASAAAAASDSSTQANQIKFESEEQFRARMAQMQRDYDAMNQRMNEMIETSKKLNEAAQREIDETRQITAALRRESINTKVKRQVRDFAYDIVRYVSSEFRLQHAFNTNLSGDLDDDATAWTAAMVSTLRMVLDYMFDNVSRKLNMSDREVSELGAEFAVMLENMIQLDLVGGDPRPERADDEDYMYGFYKEQFFRRNAGKFEHAFRAIFKFPETMPHREILSFNERRRIL